MQVTVEAGSGLERRMTIQVPEERIVTEVATRLKSIARTARIHGFRPGKAPMQVLERHYGRQVRDEVVSEVVQSSFMEALRQEALNPAAGPSIDHVDSVPGSGVSFTAVFEVYPEIALPDLSTLQLTRPRAEVTEQDVDNMIQTLRRQRRSWEAADRDAVEGDRVVLDYRGTINGEDFKGNEAKQVPVELGGGQLIDGFEAGLIGIRAGEERTLELTFPESYHDKEVAGKPVTFHVQASKVEEARLPEVDADFIHSFGIAEGGVEGLRNEVRDNMERELHEALRSKLKEQVMDNLLETCRVEVPKALVDGEAERLAHQTRDSLAAQGGSGINLPASMFEERARRRVALGLILAELMKLSGLRPDPDKVRARVEAIASSYEEPEQVVRWYYGDRQRLSEIESVVTEEQLVDWLLGQSQVTEAQTTFDDVMKPGQTSA